MPQHSGKVWYIKNSLCAFIYCIFTSLGFSITALVSVLQDAVHGHIQSEEDNFATQTPGRSSQNEKQRGSHWAGVYKIMIRRENNQSTWGKKRKKKACSVCSSFDVAETNTPFQPPGRALPARPLGLEGPGSGERHAAHCRPPHGTRGLCPVRPLRQSDVTYRVLNCPCYKPILAKTTLKITGHL